jgi:hypothetical protein
MATFDMYDMYDMFDMFDMFDMGRGGGRGATGGRVRPIGISPSPVPGNPGAGPLSWWKGNQWPPAVVQLPELGNIPPPVDQPTKWPVTALAKDQYPARAWETLPIGTIVLSEFVQAEIDVEENTRTWKEFRGELRQHLPEPAHGQSGATFDKNHSYNAHLPDNLEAELRELALLIEYRGAVMAEALAQRSGGIGYFRGILSFTAASHPATAMLCAVALQIGHFQAMYYKKVFKRPRPSQRLPHLMPPIDPPGHAAFPSGHATQAWLIAEVLKKVIPICPAEVPDPANPPQTQPAPEEHPLNFVAQRIARNREVLGLHYPSDSAAGRRLADVTLLLLEQCPTINAPNANEGGLFDHQNGLLAMAQAEWL